MTLSQESKLKAKQKAKAYLEYSIYTLCLTLGVDPSDLPEEYVNPVDVENGGGSLEHWQSHESLKLQLQAYAKLV